MQLLVNSEGAEEEMGDHHGIPVAERLAGPSANSAWTEVSNDGLVFFSGDFNKVGNAWLWFLFCTIKYRY